MSRLLIIGAGYVGAELARQAREGNMEVIPVTRSGENGTQAADVSCVQSLTALRDRVGAIDVLVHCASSGRGGAEAYRKVYYEGVQNLQTVFANVPLLFVSSTSVYAQIDGEIVTELSRATPERETGQILRATEDLVTSQQGSVARLSGIYGPGRSVLLKKLLRQEASIEEDGRRTINQIHRDDAASALLFLVSQLLTGVTGTYNVSDSHPRSQKATYVGLCKLFKLPLPPIMPRDLNRKRGWTHKSVSNAKLISLGWAPKHPDFLSTASEIAETLPR